MNAQLIAALASRRAKLRNLPLKRMCFDNESSVDRLVQDSKRIIDKADRYIAWGCVIGLVLAVIYEVI